MTDLRDIERADANKAVAGEARAAGAFVKVTHGPDAAANAYEAISAVCDRNVRGKQVLLKVNTGFRGPARSGLCTNPDVVAGLIRYFRDRGAARIIVGDSSIVGVDSIEALAASGITEVCHRDWGIEGGAACVVECVDLNSAKPVIKAIPNGIMVDSIMFSSIAYECDIVVSVPVIKTHMYTGATLSIKNMKGTMWRREKTKLHRLGKPLPADAVDGVRALDYGLLDLTHVCYPDYAVIDGTVCMEGFGPSGGAAKRLDLVLASSEPVAADLIALRLMEMPLADVGHLRLIACDRGIGYDNIRVDPVDFTRWASRFQLASEARLGLACDALELVDESACSACHAALMQFLRYHAHKFEGGPVHTIFAGKDVSPAQVAAAPRPFLVGNCTAPLRGLAPFCKGCPPIPSEIAKTLKGESGMEIKFLGHSSFMIASKEYSLLIDPFLSGNPSAAAKVDEVNPTHILVTHGHGDHLGDAVSIASRTHATVFATVETAASFPEGTDIEVGQIGGSVPTDFGRVKFTPAAHGSGAPGGLACGFLVEFEGKKIYHAGDTGLIADMALLEAENIDLALLPIGDRFTMGPSDALRAVKMIKPRKVVPMHYNTMPAIAQDPVQWKKDVEAATDTEVIVLAPGESLQL
ncbi:MAG: metal-dependent hydrolase [Firmicutes bacterium ADurb.Bin506]|nr:MAG: metal-dependent hydrolase [Firmicutes bacterium ADurb.Bin506]